MQRLQSAGGAAWRDFTREQLEREYSPRALVPSIDPYLARYAELSAEARRRHQVLRDVGYGSSPEETLDFFPAPTKGAPVHVFLHGGYWRLLSKEESSFAAPAFVERGACFVALNYALAPRARLDEIVRQCRAAIAWLHRNAAGLGGDPGRIHVSGSSAGGHLVAMLLATDWENQAGVPADVLKGGCSVSGLFDIEPVRYCSVNEDLHLDAEEARRNSPLLQLRKTAAELILARGQVETAEWKRQNREYARAWNAINRPCAEIEVGGRNHFDVVLDLADPTTALAQAALAQMGLG